MMSTNQKLLFSNAVPKLADSNENEVEIVQFNVESSSRSCATTLSPVVELISTDLEVINELKRTPTKGINDAPLMSTPKKRKFWGFSRFSDLSEEDFSTPTRPKYNLSVMKNRVKKLSYTNKLLNQKNKRLEMKIETLNDVISKLQKNSTLNDSSPDVIKNLANTMDLIPTQLNQSNSPRLHTTIEIELDKINEGVELDYGRNNALDKSCKNEPEKFIKEGFERTDRSQFKCLKYLGKGSFGKVYLVKKLVGQDNGKLYAMKVLNRSAVDSSDGMPTREECNILAKMCHPFVIQLYYGFQTENTFYLIMDYFRGGDIFKNLCKKKLTEEDVKFYSAEIALALDYIHSHGIIYRDFKLDNILLDADGHICLTDFGLSKVLLNNQRMNSFCGIIEYMAPELLIYPFNQGYTFVADWWSFGVLMHEMLTGCVPFHENNPIDTINKILHDNFFLPQTMSFEAQSLLRLLLNKKSNRRLANILELKNHAFFEPIDWDKLYRKEICPPYRPALYRADDAHHFDSESTSVTSKDSPYIQKCSDDQESFQSFNSIATFLTDENDIMHDNTYVPTIETEKYLKEFDDIKKLTEEYEIKHEIGRGSYSSYKLCVHKMTSLKYVIKIIDKLHRSQEEINILQSYKHSNIVTLKNVYEDNDFVYLVMKYMKGGELIDRLHKLKDYSEKDASAILYVITSTICYLHNNGVVHKDLRPSNFLFANDSASPDTLIISNFGLAKKISMGNNLIRTADSVTSDTQKIRTEVFDKADDIWSLGVLLYILLTGKTPYSNDCNDSQIEVINRICDNDIDFESENWQVVTTDAKDLVTKMLHIDPHQRPTALEILSSPWIKYRDKLPTATLDRTHWQKTNEINVAIKATYRAVRKLPITPILEPLDLGQMC